MSIAFLSVRPKAIKLKVIPKIPADFHDGVGTQVNKAESIFSIDLDYADFPPSPIPPNNNQQVLLWDQALGTYTLIPAHNLGGDITVDAPADNFTYGRLNGTWDRALSLTSGGTVTGPTSFTSTLSASGTATFTGTIAVPTPTLAGQATNKSYVDGAVGGVAGTALPLMDGVAAVGVSALYSRQDHVHPTDTTRAPLVSPPLTGTPTAPTAAQDTNTTQIATTAFVVGQAGTANPLMNGAVAVGASLRYSRQDHVHPTDTSRAANAPFVASGPGHAQGLVPDPGSVAGATKFLREDATWQVPAGGGGGGANVYIQDTAPVGATAGSLWWQSSSGQLFVYYNDGTSSQWVFASAQAATTVMRGYISGLILSTAGGSTTFAVAPGIASDATNVDMLALVSGLSKTTSAWAAGTGVGALDAGAIAASTWYHVHIIKNPSTQAVDVLISLSASAPSLPSGYTLYRRIGSMKTNASSQWLGFTQIGNQFIWAAQANDWNVTNIGTTPALITLSVPTGVIVTALITAAFNNSATVNSYLWLHSPFDTGPMLVASVYSQAVSANGGASLSIVTNTSAQIVGVNGFASNNSNYVATDGWIDPRNSDVTLSANNAIVPVNVVRGYISGLILSTAGSSTTFSVAPGIAADTTAFDMMNLPNALNKTTAAWAVGSGNGALDTGSIAASTWYHVHLIKRIDSGLVDVLISLSATSPSLPLGYTLSRRIGSLKTNASSQWTLFHQNGNEFLWDAVVGETIAASSTAALFTLTVPTGVQVNALGIGTLVSATAGAFVLFASPDVAVATPNVPTGNITSMVATASSSLGSQFTANTRTNSSAQIRAVTGGTAPTINYNTVGWIDLRGADVAQGGVVPAIPVIQGQLQGLTLSTAGSSATFSVAAGVACDGTAVAMMKLGAAINKTTAAWVAGSGNGALDTGSIAASTWYHVHIIQNPTTGAVDILISLSAAAPTLPSGFTLFRRIGSMKTNASSQWTLFHQLGDEFLWDTRVADQPGITGSASATLQVLSVPTGVQVLALYAARMDAGTANDNCLMTSPDESDQAPGGAVGSFFVVANAILMQSFQTRTNLSAQIRHREAASTSTWRCSTYGWIDRRGRDN